MEDAEEFYTVIEFAEKIRVHPNTVRRAIRQGRIQAFKTSEGIKSEYRIPNTEVKRLCELDMTKLIKDIVTMELEKKICQKK